MKKLQILKKRVAIEGGVAGGILLVLLTSNWFLSDSISVAALEATQIEGQIHSITSQASEEEKKMDIVKSSLDEYIDIKEKLDSGALGLNREKAEEILTTLKERYRLSKFNASIAAPVPLSGPKITNRLLEGLYSDVRVNFEAMSDIHVLSFAQQLIASMPGFVKITGLTINKVEGLTSGNLVKIAKGEIPPVISASLIINWYGMRMSEKPVNTNPVPPPNLGE